jgi:hypothetical protein
VPLGPSSVPISGLRQGYGQADPDSQARWWAQLIPVLALTLDAVSARSASPGSLLSVCKVPSFAKCRLHSAKACFHGRGHGAMAVDSRY